MENMIKQQIESLIMLQQIEIEADSIQASLDSVEQRVQALDANVKGFEKNIETEEAVVNELNHKYRDYESDVQMNLERISKSKQKLSAVKTNKEYQSSLKEIEDLQKINSKIEDEMIAYLDRIEGAEKKIAEAKSEYSEMAVQADAEKNAIKDEADRGKKRLSLLYERRDDISKEIDAKLLEQYNQTKAKQINRIAMVAAKDAVCQGCNMNIPPQLYNELHRFDRLLTCPNCQRIIYLYDRKQRPE